MSTKHSVSNLPFTDGAKTPDERVQRISALPPQALAKLLACFGLHVSWVAESQPIPGSFWGEPEAGVIADTVYVRPDTPVHSALHEACHLITAGENRRPSIHTDASDCQFEEDATCYLQIMLAQALPNSGAEQVAEDMDLWGYSFRLGSAKAWFQQDAAEARQWLVERDIITAEDALAAQNWPPLPPKRVHHLCQD